MEPSDSLAEPLSNEQLADVREMVASGTVYIGGKVALQLLDELTDLRTCLAAAHAREREAREIILSHWKDHYEARPCQCRICVWLCAGLNTTKAP